MRIAAPLVFSLFAVNPLVAQTIERDVMVVFDMSGSMWGQVDGVAKVEIAQDAFGDLIDDWNANNTRAGLIAYGHRRKGDCSDIELLAEPKAGADIASLIAGLRPRGKTPLSDAVKQAANVLKFTEEAATVVLLSDGIETCNADPCVVGAELEALGLDFTAHVIGFDIAEGDKAQLQCLATTTGGQYFDAADARGLSEAMKGVAQVTAVAAPEELVGQDFQTVTIRVQMESGTLALPKELIVLGNETALGTLTDETAVIPGLSIDMPFGPITLRVQGDGITGEVIVDITDQTEIIDLQVTGDEADYVIWREGQLPVLEGGKEHIVLIKDTTGVDRASFYRSFLYPAGSTDPADAIKAGNMQPLAGIYAAVRVPSPATPGDYELVPTGTDGTEYGRIPFSFVTTIDPVWQGPSVFAPGEIIDAYWAGSSNRRDRIRFMNGDQRVSDISVDAMATDDGFQLTAPDEPGLYDLVFTSDFENSLGSKITPLGQIAVGVPLPQDDAIDFNVEDMKAETDAMGGEDVPLLVVGELHGDWQLVMQNNQRTIPLVKFQLNHAASEPTSTGGLVVEADPSWGFGPKGGFGDATLTQQDDDDDDDGLLMTIAVDGNSTDYVMMPEGTGWTTEILTEAGGATKVLLIKADELAAADIARDTVPVDHQLIAVDERDNRLETPVTWTLQHQGLDLPVILQAPNGKRMDDIGRQPGTYRITAQSGDMRGDFNIELGSGHPRANVVVLKPTTEGGELALDVKFFCSAGEDCDMTMSDVPVDFSLAEGWGAERPFRVARGMAMFNMTTNTASGPFFVTLNQPQRMADLGPCTELVTGTFCHDATDDPALLADIALMQRSLSFKPVGMWLNEDRFDTLLNELTGDDQ